MAEWNDGMNNEAEQERGIFSRVFKTPLGKIRAAAWDNAIGGLWFFGQKYFPCFEDDFWLNKPDYPPFVLLETWLKNYFSGKKPKMDIPLAPIGTGFQKAVWKKLLEIPYGQTTTYGTIAAQLNAEGTKASAQAVGQAVGHNPISLLVPCHRVLGSGGRLTGYAGGLEKKYALLELEGAVGIFPDFCPGGVFKQRRI